MTARQTAALACRDCGEPLERRTGKSGRQLERCEPCRKAHTLRWQREDYAKRRSIAAQLAGGDKPLDENLH